MELLVVVAIIAVLLALLLPAVQSARESARRIMCANNMRQIGVALHQYNGVRNKLPPGNLWTYGYAGSVGQFPDGSPFPGNPPNRHRGTMHVFILPYLEQSNLFSALTFSSTAANVYQQSVGGKQLREHVIGTFQCPSDMVGTIPNSDEYSSAVRGNAICSYFGSAGDPCNGGSAANGNPDSPCVESYFVTYRPFSGNGGFVNAYGGQVPNPAGVFARDGNNWQCRFKEITDGLSHTIMVGEGRVGCSYQGEIGWARTDNLNGLSSFYIPLNYDSCVGGADAATAYAKAQAQGFDGCASKYNYNTARGFKSRHPGTVNFLLCDGSVISVSENCDQFALARLGCRADGKPVGAL